MHASVHAAHFAVEGRLGDLCCIIAQWINVEGAEIAATAIQRYDSEQKGPSQARTTQRSQHVDRNAHAPSRVTARPPLSVAACLKQEPRAALRLVDPVLDQAGARDVAALVAEPVHLTQADGELLVVIAQLGKHILWRHELRIIVEQAL